MAFKALVWLETIRELNPTATNNHHCAAERDDPLLPPLFTFNRHLCRATPLTQSYDESYERDNIASDQRPTHAAKMARVDCDEITNESNKRRGKYRGSGQGRHGVGQEQCKRKRDGRHA